MADDKKDDPKKDDPKKDDPKKYKVADILPSSWAKGGDIVVTVDGKKVKRADVAGK